MGSMTFGQAAVSLGFATEALLQECSAVQRKMRELGVDEPLGEIMIKKGLLTAQQHSQILKKIGVQVSPIPGYSLLSKIGQGGMGTVYKAMQGSVNRTVAIKIMAPHASKDPTFVARFRREAQAAASLNHPNIVAVYDWGEDGDDYFIVMEYVAGRTLREVSASARVSLGYLSEVERGQKEASSELLAAICGALNTPLSQVFREVSDNFALAELQNEPVLAIPREPGLRVPAEAGVGLDGEHGFVPISTMVPDEEFADGRAGFGAASGRVHDVTDMVSVLSIGYAPQTQALGFSVRFRIVSGRFPDTMSASVTCSSTARSLARSAIHTCCSGSATPG